MTTEDYHQYYQDDEEHRSTFYEAPLENMPEQYIIT